MTLLTRVNFFLSELELAGCLRQAPAESQVWQMSQASQASQAPHDSIGLGLTRKGGASALTINRPFLKNPDLLMCPAAACVGLQSNSPPFQMEKFIMRPA